MAKNERIIAQDLTEIKGALQQYSDPKKIYDLCTILSREIKKYPIDPKVSSRIEKISLPSKPSSLSKQFIEDAIKEIDELVDILIST